MNACQSFYLDRDNIVMIVVPLTLSIFPFVYFLFAYRALKSIFPKGICQSVLNDGGFGRWIYYWRQQHLREYKVNCIALFFSKQVC